jgi:hypothetical protein
MRSLGIVPLVLLVVASLAPTQGVSFYVKPKEAALGQTVLVVLDNQSTNTLFLPGGLWPWSMHDSKNELAYAPPPLPVASPIPPRTKMQWPWDQRDRNGKLVSPGAYEARVFYYVIGVGNYQGRAPLTIKPVSVVVEDPASPGARVNLGLFAQESAGLTYRLALAFSDTPGIPLPGKRTVPLAPDVLFFYSVLVGPPFFNNFVGTLDSRGQASAYLKIPNDPNLRGYTVYAAFVTFDPTAPGGFRTVSDAASFPIR